MGAEILIHDDRRSFMQVFDGHNIIVRNMVIDYADQTGSSFRPRTFTQGIIRKVDRSSRTFDIEIDLSRFIAPDETFTTASSGSWGYAIDPNVSGKLKYNSEIHYPTDSVRRIGANRFRVQSTLVDGLDAGDRYVLQRRHRNPVFLVASHSKQVSLIGVRAYSSVGVFVSSIVSESLNVIRSSMTIRPNSGRWKSGNADGVHVQSNRVGPWVAQSRFQGLGDDVMNFYSLPYTIVAKLSPRELVLAPIIRDTLGDVYQETFKYGDEFEFTDPVTGSLIQTARLVDVSGQNRQVTIQGKRVRRDMVVVTFDQNINGIKTGHSPAEDKYSFRNETTVFNRALSRDFLVERNYISDSRRLGNYVVAENGELNHNTYVGLSDQAILGRNESAWPIGSWPSNISIRSNTFHGNGFSRNFLQQNHSHGIVDFHMNRLPDFTIDRDSREIRGLKIVDNTFRRWRKSAISVRNAEGVTILGNRFSAPLDSSQNPIAVKFSTFK
jgi:hypothetical protein